MMVPVGRLVLLRTVPKTELVRAMAWLTVPALIGPVLGPPLGGFITTYVELALDLLDQRADRRARHRAGLALHSGPARGAAAALRREGLPVERARAARPGRGLRDHRARPRTGGRRRSLLLAAGGVGVGLYLWHARRLRHPLLDLALLRVPTFRAALVGGFLFRIGIGALPFLLPLMLQAAFGLDAFNSGLLTFAAAAGAMAMKVTAQPILKLFGFKRVLIANALISSAFIAVIGLFQPTTPHLLILLVLLAGGFFRSLQFTSVNTLGYADIERAQMSRATSLASMMQQLSLTVGVGTGALLLHLSMAARGAGQVATGDFTTAFVAVALVAALSALVYLPLAADAGAAVSGQAPLLTDRPTPDQR